MRPNPARSLCICWIWMLLFWIALPCSANQKNSNLQNIDEFYAIHLEKGEIAYMLLGDHSEVIVRVSDATILFDPTGLKKDELAALKSHGVDLVLFSHQHWDHFSRHVGLELFKGSNAYIAVEPCIETEFLKDVTKGKLIVTNSGKTFQAGNIKVDALEGKHIGPIMLFRITVDGIRIFHGGDSDHVPLEALESDIAFVPTGDPSPTCSPKSALKMVFDVNAQVAVPIHGTEREHNKFKKKMEKKLPEKRVIVSVPYSAQKVSLH